MQSLGEKRSLSKDFNFAINEDAGRFLGGCKQRNHHQLFHEGQNHTPAVQQAAIADSENLFKGLQESLNDLRKADSSMVPDDVTATALLSLDNDVIPTAPKISEGVS